MAILSQLYDDARFVNLAKNRDKVYFGRIMARYPYFVIDQSPSQLNLYGEIKEDNSPNTEPRFDTFSVQVPMRVILNPEKQLLKKFGQDNSRDALVEFSIAVMEELGINPKQGDRFRFNEEEYELMGAGRESYFWNQKVPLRIILPADKSSRIRASNV